MATFKQIAVVTPNAASNTSLSSAFTFPTEFNQYAIFIPPLFANTATCGIRILTYPSAEQGTSGTTYATMYPVYLGYNWRTASVTSNSLINQWESVHSVACTGAMVLCDALAFCPGIAKFQFTATTTANTSFAIYGRKED